MIFNHSFYSYKRKQSLFILLFFIVFLNHSIYGQSQIVLKRNLSWKNQQIFISEKNVINALVFDNALINDYSCPLPLFHEAYYPENNFKCDFSLFNTVYLPDSSLLYKNIQIPVEVLTTKQSFEKGRICYDIIVFPYRYNLESKQMERLISFEILVNKSSAIVSENNKIDKRASSNSVLAEGDWYKIRVSESGIFKIDYNFLKSMGIDPDKINPKNIKIYGNGGGMLPMPNHIVRPEDLIENAITVVGEEDIVFNTNDYILFYAQGPHTWTFNNNLKMYVHSFNYYSDYAYYFLTISHEAGLRIQQSAPVSGTPVLTVSDYDYYDFHEKVMKTEITDYVKSGRDWYGEELNLTNTLKVSFSIPNINLNYPVKFVSHVAGRSSSGSSFTLKVDGNTFTQNIYSVNTADYLANYSSPRSDSFSFMPNKGSLEFLYTYNKPDNNSIGWLNFLRINARANLKINSGQIAFRDTSLVNKGIVEIQINSSQNDFLLWDVTDPLKPVRQQKLKNGSIFSFKADYKSIHELIGCVQGGEKVPAFVAKITNQNLHAVKDFDMVIITHPDYITQSNKLADFRRTNDSLRVFITTPQQIYNEFSSGAQDITAIRDFLRNVYKNNTDSNNQLKYVLLVGDASYDYRDVLNGNTNRIPTYQSPTIYSPISSYASDDYYGFLDDDEGNWDDIYATQYDKIDIAIGRLPVSTSQQASEVINKIIHYSSSQCFDEWRNNILFVSDDVDDGGLNAHVEHSEYLSQYLASQVKNLNITKLYMDAYQQVSSINGNRYPDAQKTLNQMMDKGMLIVNYIGHGGELGWAHERVLEISDINSWSNFDRLPVFVTATCEFSRYDDPVRISAGELVLLNPKGGAAALLTTSRVVYVQANEILTSNIYESNIFDKINNHHKRLGDILVLAKNKTTFSDNTRKFILLGDPSMKLAYPDYIVKPTNVPDTLKALQNVSISGNVEDIKGNKLSDFSGNVMTTIYDKSTILKTLDNDHQNKAISFSVMNNIIFKGKASVKNGDFKINFIVPKDISYADGVGKISFYATNKSIDASGYYDKFIIGGTADSLIKDTTAPVVKVFIGDSNFISGGITNENPTLYVQIHDENGINTVGSGIGHEIIGFLDNDNSFLLNNYYQSKLNSYQDGEIFYPLQNIPEGKHRILVKVWDVWNNSATGSVEFEVKKYAEPQISNIFTYPNPFTNSTVISFEHNLSDHNFDVKIDIFTTKGNIIQTIERQFDAANSNRITSIEWNPYNNGMNLIEPGLYLINIFIKASDGTYAVGSCKTLYVR